jgi:hypothetical protein
LEKERIMPLNGSDIAQGDWGWFVLLGVSAILLVGLLRLYVAWN